MAVDYIGNNKPDGMCFGLLPAEKVAFHGTTPVIQQTVIADATDAATAITTTNSINAVLQAYGLTAS